MMRVENVQPGQQPGSSSSSSSSESTRTTPVLLAPLDLIHKNLRAHGLLKEFSPKGSAAAHRGAQEVITNDNSASAYLKCYSLVDEVASTSGSVNRERYVEFLQLMTDGDINVGEFEDLPAVYVMIFYTSACTGENTGTCFGVLDPALEVGSTEDPTTDLQFFCKQILKNTETVADAAFEYTIRYDPTTLDEASLATCLAEATVTVLLENLAGCTETTSRRLSDSLDSRVEHKLKHRQEERALQALGSATSGDIDCDYIVSSTVDRITATGKSSCFVW